VPINETVVDELFGLHLRKKGDYVFYEKNGKPFKDVKTSFHNALERAKLVDVRFHDLRRTFGTMCAMKNVPPKTLQKWMGHKSIETTMKYYVVSPEDFEQEAIKRLDGIVDTSTDTSKKEGIADSLRSLENIGADDGNRTRDLLITRGQVSKALALSFQYVTDAGKSISCGFPAKPYLTATTIGVISSPS
jgi:hypothetical protein